MQKNDWIKNHAKVMQTAGIKKLSDLGKPKKMKKFLFAAQQHKVLKTERKARMPRHRHECQKYLRDTQCHGERISVTGVGRHFTNEKIHPEIANDLTYVFL